MIDKINEIYIIERLIEVRKEKGLSQRDIARGIDIKESTYQGMETRRAMGLDMLIKVSDFLDVSLVSLLSKILEPQKESEIKDIVPLSDTSKDNVDTRLTDIQNTMNEGFTMLAKSIEILAQSIKESKDKGS